MVPIKDFPSYFVDEKGNIYSAKFKKLRKLSQYRSKSGTGYYMVDLCKEGKVYKRLVHRLVAEAFIPNPNNLPEVDHDNNDMTINESWNLKWISSKDNVHKSYAKMSPVRNYRECELYNGDTCLGEFKSVTAACKFASEKYGISASSLDKYRKIGPFRIVSKKDVTTSQ